MNTNLYVSGTFNDFESANTAVDNLESRGFNESQISVITKEDVVKGKSDISRDPAAGGISKAAATGGIIGGVIGLLTGIGAIAIPGIGALMIAGPIASTFGIGTAAAATASGAISGILAGGLVGALKELGFDEAKAKAIENKVKNGSILMLVGIKNDDEKDTVRKVLKDSNADSVDEVTYNG